MPTKFELLREGKAVEVEPGLSGRLNKDKKTLELSSGEVLNVSNDPDFFPKGSQELDLSRQKEQIERGIAKSPFGEFGHQFSQQGLAGGAQDWVSYLTQSGDEYLTRKRAEREVSERISQESPVTSAAATGASFIPDIVLTRGMSAARAAPLLAAGSAGSRLVTEPGEVLKEGAIAGGLGFGLDKTMNYLNKVTQRRALSRSIPQQQEAVNAQNIAGKEATDLANAQQRQQFGATQQSVQNENAARLHQHNLELTARQNKMIDAQNTFEQAQTARNAEVARLKTELELAKAQRSTEATRLDSEYKAAKSAAEAENKRLTEDFKLAQQQYKQALDDLPRLQKEAQKQYSQNVIKSVQDIENAFPKDARILTEQLDTPRFIQESINSTGLAGSREGAQVSRFLNSILPEGEVLTSKQLSKKYQAIEEAIQRGSPEVQSVLNQFKEHLAQRLPVVFEDSLVYQKIMPRLAKDLEKEVASVISKMGRVDSKIIANLRANTANALKEINATDFANRLQNGQLTQDLIEKIAPIESFLPGLTGKDLSKMSKAGPNNPWSQAYQNIISQGKAQQQQFVEALSQKINNNLARQEIGALYPAKEASQKMGRKINKTLGLASPLESPVAPQSPQLMGMPSIPPELPPVQPINLPGPIASPQALPMPSKPGMMAQPNAPMPQSFMPEPLPTLPGAQGTAEMAGDFLEKDLLRGSGVLNNPLAKLAGLKYLAGKATLPIEAGYLAAKGLTSPTGAGEVARMSFKQGGIQAIEALAQKYPSYHNGILENPQERRSLTKEIEDDSEIPLEQKALLQSKINRGKPLSERLQ